jgi:homoserine dehydrogenase
VSRSGHEVERLSLTHTAHADRTQLDRDTVRIALLGCGTVGSGVANLLIGSASAIAARSGVAFALEAIAVLSLDKPRTDSIPRSLLSGDARALVLDPAIDVVIECIGGTGVAADLVETALVRGKHVVTANKDLLATRGPELRSLARARGVTIAYEAAVGGAIPIVRTLTASLAGEEILEVGGVLNGTTNFILSAMFDGETYASALAKAQRLGFAEADPTNDVEGIDAAHKLAILAQLAFGRGLVTSEIPRVGITGLVPDDLTLAKRLGYRLKLIACARRDASLVTPAYVHTDHPFAQPAGPQNCIRITGRNSGSLTFAGAGAGGAPTASAVISDVVAVLRHIAAGRHVGLLPDDDSLTPVTAAHEPSIPLPRIVRLHSLRDVRPAREALIEGGFEATALDGMPALVTKRVDGDAPVRLESLLATHAIVAQSIVPLWEDVDPHAYPEGSHV